ncbi:MAG: hypothetical protein AB7U05_02815 [Mangrovibacterium sp.]
MNHHSKADTINILVAPEAEAMGIGDYLAPIPIKLKTLKQNLEMFTKQLGEIIPEVPVYGGYELTDISVQVNITAGGELQLVGLVKGKGEITGGLTLTFRKAPSQQK